MSRKGDAVAERFITNEQIERWLIRQNIARETTRVVTAVWWGAYTIEEATEELRGIAFMTAAKCKVAPAVADAVAISAIDEEMQRQESEHQESVEAMAQAGFLALQQGADRAECRAAIVKQAKERPLPPMPHLLTQALDLAVTRQRKAEFWWKRRETAE